MTLDRKLLSRYLPSTAYVMRAFVRGGIATGLYVAGHHATGHVVAVMAFMSLVGSTEMLIAKDIGSLADACFGKLRERLNKT